MGDEEDEFRRWIGSREPALRNLIVLGAIALIACAALATAFRSGAD